jgi:hypothetical protein
MHYPILSCSESKTMNRLLSSRCLRKENLAYDGTGGVSEGNRTAGFIPAFCDSATGRVEPSRLSDGRMAPMHLLVGLPPEWVVARGDGEEVLAIKATVIAGFLRAGTFYTRAQAAQAVAPHLLANSSNNPQQTMNTMDR